jgi:hypothetical protein
MKDFINKVPKKSVEPVELSDLQRIKEYQLELINLLAYEPPRQPSGLPYQYSIDAIYKEISDIEIWLKKQWNIFMNDSNRKLIE